MRICFQRMQCTYIFDTHCYFINIINYNQGNQNNWNINKTSNIHEAVIICIFFRTINHILE